MYHDRTAWRFAFLWAKNMDAAKDIHKEMLPIWAAEASYCCTCSLWSPCGVGYDVSSSLDWFLGTKQGWRKHRNQHHTTPRQE
jgi:hypothetical protein